MIDLTSSDQENEIPLEKETFPGIAVKQKENEVYVDEMEVTEGVNESEANEVLGKEVDEDYNWEVSNIDVHLNVGNAKHEAIGETIFCCQFCPLEFPSPLDCGTHMVSTHPVEFQEKFNVKFQVFNQGRRRSIE